MQSWQSGLEREEQQADWACLTAKAGLLEAGAQMRSGWLGAGEGVMPYYPSVPSGPATMTSSFTHDIMVATCHYL